MPANNTNQSMLRRAQGGSPTTQGQNERAQRNTRNPIPNTAYNQGSNSMSEQYNPQLYYPQIQNPHLYNPHIYYPPVQNPSNSQFGNQQNNLGRYQPPGFGGNQRGPYAYNLPNAWGDQMGGGMQDYLQQLMQMFQNPFGRQGQMGRQAQPPEQNPFGFGGDTTAPPRDNSVPGSVPGMEANQAPLRDNRVGTQMGGSPMNNSRLPGQGPMRAPPPQGGVQPQPRSPFQGPSSFWGG